VPSPDLEIIAHRGYSTRAPENTLAAVETAIRAGADAIEWDVHVAACGTPVLFHDANLSRTTNGVGPIRSHTLVQLQMLDAGRWFGVGSAGEKIPSLADALELTKGRVRRVYTEVKGFRELEDLYRMVDIVREADRIIDHVFISLDWAILDHIAEHDPTARIGYIVDLPERCDEALERATPNNRSLIDFDYRLVIDRAELVKRATDQGVAVAVWTVDDPAEAQVLCDAGVTRFTTNQVEALLAWRVGVT
jgi:glycerophosphoryl diester phosphodiesterase